jgi:hypothetical protein
MSKTINSKDAIDIAINGSKEFLSKAASASPDTPLQPDIRLQAHLLMKDELVKSAEAIRGENPQSPFIEKLIKIAEFVEKGYPAKTVAAYVTEGDQDSYNKLAEFLTSTGNAILTAIVTNDFNKRVQNYKASKQAAAVKQAAGIKPAAPKQSPQQASLIAKQAAAVAQSKYPHLARASEKLQAFRQFTGK